MTVTFKTAQLVALVICLIAAVVGNSFGMWHLGYSRCELQTMLRSLNAAEGTLDRVSADIERVELGGASP